MEVKGYFGLVQVGLMRGQRGQGLDPLRHLRDRGGMGGPTKQGVAQGGNPTGLELGAGRVEVALTSQGSNEDGVPPR